MDLSTFKQSIGQDAPPEGLGQALAALWHEATGDWDRAHRLVVAGAPPAYGVGGTTPGGPPGDRPGAGTAGW